MIDCEIESSQFDCAPFLASWILVTQIGILQRCSIGHFVSFALKKRRRKYAESLLKKKNINLKNRGNNPIPSPAPLTLNMPIKM